MKRLYYTHCPSNSWYKGYKMSSTQDPANYWSTRPRTQSLRASLLHSSLIGFSPSCWAKSTPEVHTKGLKIGLGMQSNNYYPGWHWVPADKKYFGSSCSTVHVTVLTVPKGFAQRPDTWPDAHAQMNRKRFISPSRLSCQCAGCLPFVCRDKLEQTVVKLRVAGPIKLPLKLSRPLGSITPFSDHLWF